MQIVYLSARPQVLAETLAHLRANLPWVEDVVVVCPADLADAMPDAVTVLTDAEVVGYDVSGLDHARRNYALRVATAIHPAVQSTFLMSDDDHRPLGTVDRSYFETPDGQHRRYWFASLDEWRLDLTEFDRAQLGIKAALAGRVSPVLAYSVHAPQIIDRDLFIEVANRLAPAEGPLDEWSTYFNLAPTIAPDRFAEPDLYRTLAWPDNPRALSAHAEPIEPAWENYYAEHYVNGQVFAGIATDDASDAAAAEKVMRWPSFAAEVRSGAKDSPVALAAAPAWRRAVAPIVRRVRRP